jgi:Lar family restriction alleviation protein
MTRDEHNRKIMSANIQPIKPCPFCGAKAEDEDGPTLLGSDALEDWYVYCGNCRAHGPESSANWIAVEDWNKRVGHGTT